MTPKDSVLYEFDSRECAEVAYYMYLKWEEEMQPPLYKYIDFKIWLDKIMLSHRKSKDNTTRIWQPNDKSK